MNKVIALVMAMSISGCAVAPVMAAEAAKPAPTVCGKTVDECQKIIDQKDTQIKNLTTAFQAAVQQRNTAEQNLMDTQLNNFVVEQTKVK